MAAAAGRLEAQGLLNRSGSPGRSSARNGQRARVPPVPPRPHTRPRRGLAAPALQLGGGQPGSHTTNPIKEVPVMPHVQNGRFTADVSSLGDEMVVFMIGMRVNKPWKVKRVAGLHGDAEDAQVPRQASRQRDARVHRAYYPRRSSSSTGSRSKSWNGLPGTVTTHTSSRGGCSIGASAAPATSGSGTRRIASCLGASRRSTATCPRRIAAATGVAPLGPGRDSAAARIGATRTDHPSIAGLLTRGPPIKLSSAPPGLKGRFQAVRPWPGRPVADCPPRR